MKILAKDVRHGRVKVMAETLDDLWYLSQVLGVGDIAEGMTYRKVKVGEKQEAVKRRFFVKLSIEKVEFQKYSNVLKALGTTLEEHEDIPKGSYHSFDIEEGTIITIIKSEWLNYQINLLEEASDAKRTSILAVAFDRESALFAWLKKNAFETITTLQGDVAKKDVDVRHSDFFAEITQLLQQYGSKADHIILASPSFWKDELFKTLKDPELRKKTITCNCGSATIAGLNEALKSDDVRKALANDRAAAEAELVQELEAAIAKEGNYAYGVDEVEKASQSGAIEDLLITEQLILKKREADAFLRIERIMKDTDKKRGKIHILSSDHDAGRKLDGLGGIGALLRYKLY